MTRRRLWIATTACCALLALPTIVRLIRLVMPASVSWASALATTRRVSASVVDAIQATAARTRHIVTTAVNSGGIPAASRAPATVTPPTPTSAAATQTQPVPHRVGSDQRLARKRPHRPGARRVDGCAHGIDRARRRSTPSASARSRTAARPAAGQAWRRRRCDRAPHSGSRRTPCVSSFTPRLESDRAAFADLLAASPRSQRGSPGAFTPRRGHTQAVLLPSGKGEACLVPTTIIPGSRSDR